MFYQCAHAHQQCTGRKQTGRNWKQWQTEHALWTEQNLETLVTTTELGRIPKVLLPLWNQNKDNLQLVGERTGFEGGGGWFCINDRMCLPDCSAPGPNCLRNAWNLHLISQESAKVISIYTLAWCIPWIVNGPGAHQEALSEHPLCWHKQINIHG